MRTFKWGIITLVSIILIIFAVANRQLVTLSLFPLPFEVDISVFLLIFLSLIIGAMLGGISTFSFSIAYFRATRAAANRITSLEQEIAALKASSHIVESVADTPSAER